jgi:hypothetical protein
VAFLDSDDRWLPGKLAAQRALLAARTDLVCCFTDFRTADVDGRESSGGLAGWLGGPTDFAARVALARPLGTLAPTTGGFAAAPTHVGDFRAAAMRQNIVNIGTVLARKALVGPELGCATDLPTSEEIPAVARMLAAGPAGYLAVETLVQHDHRGARLTGSGRLVRQRVRVTLLERVWSADPVLRAGHAAELEALLRAERIALAQLLLAEGAVAEARDVLARLEHAPASLALLAKLPVAAVSGALAVRRRLRAVQRRTLALLPWLSLSG